MNGLYPISPMYPTHSLGMGVVQTAESPETAIARYRPEIAARVLEKDTLAGVHNHASSDLTSMAITAMQTGNFDKGIEYETAAQVRQGFFGIGNKTLRFKGRVKKL